MPRPAAVLLGAPLLALTVWFAPLTGRTGAPATAPGTIRVIVQTSDVARTDSAVAGLGGSTARRLTGAEALVAVIRADALEALATRPEVRAVFPDRPLQGALARTAAATGARWVHENLGFDGTGVGVAIVDSGVVAAHDDLADGQIVQFVDFVGRLPQPQDGFGHGTHVAGIIAGSGRASNGLRRGIAPGAHLIVLRTLDEQGQGYISNAIAAIDYAIEQRAAFNIRVINLSVAAGVYESFRTDPLTLAAGRAVDAGIVVVTAAGNHGRDEAGLPQFGGITAPGNAPWVLTVGAADHHGTLSRTDDTVAPFSSQGPSAIDLVPKPDLVAPGVGIEAAGDPSGTLFAARPDARIWDGSGVNPYLRLSGTSMAAPVVTGTVALMLQANPGLRPDEVKAVLQVSADRSPAHSPLAQGAGFLDARAAVELARQFAGDGAARRLDDLVGEVRRRQAAWVAPCTKGADGVCAARRGNEAWTEAAAAPPAGHGTIGGAAVADGTFLSTRRLGSPEHQPPAPCRPGCRNETRTLVIVNE